MGTPRMRGSYEYPAAEVPFAGPERRQRHRVAIMRGREEIDVYLLTDTVAGALARAEDHLRFLATNNPRQWAGRYVLVAGSQRREVAVDG